MSRSPLVPKITRNQVYWTPEDIEALDKAQSFGELSKIALEVMRRMPKNVAQVCGPISSGGLGSIEKNLKEFNRTIQELVDRGEHVFDQMPFEDYIFKLIEEGKGKRGQNELLNEFYLPLFEAGFIKTFYFIRGWEKSNGARWEHDQAERLGIRIVYL